MFSFDNLDNAEQAYDKLVARVAALHPDEQDAIDEEAAAVLRKEFTDALDNDLNTSLAITAVYDVLKAKVNDKTKAMLLREFETVLGLGLFEEAAKAAGKKPAEAGESDPEIDALIAERQAARATYSSSTGIRRSALSSSSWSISGTNSCSGRWFGISSGTALSITVLLPIGSKSKPRASKSRLFRSSSVAMACGSSSVCGSSSGWAAAPFRARRSSRSNITRSWAACWSMITSVPSPAARM